MSCDYKYIRTKEEYYEEFTKRPDGYTPNNIFQDAYKIALDTRNFEIEMYWKRSTYYWTLIGAAFAAYFIVVTIGDEFPMFYKIIIGLFGLATSYAWHIASRGSKFWQKNWEKHVDFLEDWNNGPLFKIVRVSKAGLEEKLNPVRDYPISVSKINQLLSFGVILLWISMIYYEFRNFLIENNMKDFVCVILFIATLVLISLHFKILDICKSNNGIFEDNGDYAIFVNYNKKNNKKDIK